MTVFTRRKLLKTAGVVGVSGVGLSAMGKFGSWAAPEPVVLKTARTEAKLMDVGPTRDVLTYGASGMPPVLRMKKGEPFAARLVNVPLGEALGKPVVIENRGGAGGNIAIAAVKRLPADGYTILVCSSAFVVNPSLYAQAAYDPLKDYIPLMVMGASPKP